MLSKVIFVLCICSGIDSIQLFHWTALPVSGSVSRARLLLGAAGTFERQTCLDGSAGPARHLVFFRHLVENAAPQALLSIIAKIGDARLEPSSFNRTTTPQAESV